MDMKVEQPFDLRTKGIAGSTAGGGNGTSVGVAGPTVVPFRPSSYTQNFGGQRSSSMGEILPTGTLIPIKGATGNSAASRFGIGEKRVWIGGCGVYLLSSLLY